MKNIEIKARVDNTDLLRSVLKSKNAECKGIDFQTDTYFTVNSGRLKLREGNIENSLIYYKRDNLCGPKKSEVILYKNVNDESLKNILLNVFEVKKVVKKKREIYFIDNVKFHIDEVENLGSFFEIEVIDYNDSMADSEMKKVCTGYMDLFKITKENLISESYSDF